MFSDEGYRALTMAAGFVVRRDRGVVRVSGGDRSTWLQGLLTNDVLSIPAGRARYAAYLTPQGRMVSDLRVVGVEGAVLLDVPGALAGALSTRLDGLIFAEEVHVSDVSDVTAVVELYGPRGDHVLGQVNGSLHDLHVTVALDEDSGVPGWALYVETNRLEELVGVLTAQGVPEVGLQTLDVLRIETGRPRFLVDMNEDTIPLEAGLEHRAISFTKGCYVGQEIIVRVTQRGGGRVARRLSGLILEGGEVPAQGDRILSGEREIGRVTSATWSPALESPIALGYVHRDFVAPGVPVRIAHADGIVNGRISTLPFSLSQPA